MEDGLCFILVHLASEANIVMKTMNATSQSIVIYWIWNGYHINYLNQQYYNHTHLHKINILLPRNWNISHNSYKIFTFVSIANHILENYISKTFNTKSKICWNWNSMWHKWIPHMNFFKTYMTIANILITVLNKSISSQTSGSKSITWIQTNSNNLM